MLPVAPSSDQLLPQLLVAPREPSSVWGFVVKTRAPTGQLVHTLPMACGQDLGLKAERESGEEEQMRGT